jgi:hypothetical protein
VFHSPSGAESVRARRGRDQLAPLIAMRLDFVAVDSVHSSNYQ